MNTVSHSKPFDYMKRSENTFRKIKPMNGYLKSNEAPIEMENQIIDSDFE